ncbi:MAG: hypothetical protein IJE46_06080 [Clostridia bacterium]|nr:hypothetical protein [Clostridia bacterium]
MIDKIQEFLLGFGHFNIDYLSGRVNGMSVYQDSFTPVKKPYFGGGGLYRYSFFVELTSPYAADLNGNNHLIVDEFIDFIERKNLKRQLPELGDGLVSQSVKVAENIGRVKATPNKTNFRLKLELLYTKE